MKLKHKGIPFLLVVIILVMGIAYAGFAGGKKEAATEEVEEKAVVEDVRRLRTGWSWPTYIDPAVGSDISSTTALSTVYDVLVYPDLNGNAQPHVAKSWEVSEDGLKWTFYLNKGIKFHDGTELTAEDVKFSMDRLTTIGEGYAFLYGDRITSTEAPDEYTVIFNLKDPFAPFLRTMFMFFIANKDLVLANIEKPGPYGEMGDYGKKYLLDHDAGSGPYMVKEFKLEEYLFMTKNTNYWEPEYARLNPLAPDEFTMFGTMNPVTIRTLMDSRELEFSDAWQTSETLTTLDKIEGVDIAEYPGGGVFYLMMHTKKPPTDDIHFRKALAWAFDYDQAAEVFELPIAQGPIPRDIPGFDPNVMQYNQNMDKAMEELKKSKYYNQLDEYPIEFDWNSDVPVLEKIGLMFMSNVGELGIEVDLVKTPYQVMVQESADMETSPNVTTIWVAGAYPEAGALLDQRYGSASAPTVMQNEWLLDSTYDKMVNDALSTLDEQERFDKYAELQQYLVDLCPTIFMVEWNYKHAYQTYVDGPAFQGKAAGLFGYSLDPRFIKVYPEKKAELER